MRALSLLMAASMFVACRTSPPAQTTSLEIVVTDDVGDPLAEVVVGVAVDGSSEQKTDAAGKVSLSVHASRGRRVAIRAECPEAYRPVEPRTVALVTSDSLSMRFVCQPRLRTLAVVVNAPRAEGLLMRADGEPIGRVGPDGTLHAVLKRAPAAELRLMLDTGAAPLLRPQNPIEDIIVPDRDEIVVFDHTLTVASPRRARSRAPAPAQKAEPRHIPYAIGRR